LLNRTYKLTQKVIIDAAGQKLYHVIFVIVLSLIDWCNYWHV